MNTFENMPIEELLENLPNHLHLARNDNAPDHDRWRIYNSATKEYTEPGFPTVRDLLVYTYNRIEESRQQWLS